MHRSRHRPGSTIVALGFGTARAEDFHKSRPAATDRPRKRRYFAEEINEPCAKKGNP